MKLCFPEYSAYSRPGPPRRRWRLVQILGKLSQVSLGLGECTGYLDTYQLRLDMKQVHIFASSFAVASAQEMCDKNVKVDSKSQRAEEQQMKLFQNRQP